MPERQRMINTSQAQSHLRTVQTQTDQLIEEFKRNLLQQTVSWVTNEINKYRQETEHHYLQVIEERTNQLRVEMRTIQAEFARQQGNLRRTMFLLVGVVASLSLVISGVLLFLILHH